MLKDVFDKLTLPTGEKNDLYTTEKIFKKNHKMLYMPLRPMILSFIGTKQHKKGTNTFRCMSMQNKNALARQPRHRRSGSTIMFLEF